MNCSPPCRNVSQSLRVAVLNACVLAVAGSGLVALAVDPAPANAAESAASGQVPVEDSWHYTLQRPSGEAGAWQQPGFDAAAAGWESAMGGFGTPGTPAARVGTRWSTENIWLRKTFTLDSIPEQPALLMHHDETVDVYLNGHRVLHRDGYSTEYEVIALSAENAKALQAGTNVMAVHCQQTTGGQFIDVHLVDADHLPKLPKTALQLKPFKSDLITTWGEQVTAENAWTEYPRPQMKREAWTNLNGHWDYAITAEDQSEAPESFNGKILVPFSLESKLGGVGRLLGADEALWYRRQLTAAPKPGTRTLLHFEAVDYDCDVRINGQSVGTHRGGNDPFFFDVTDAIQEGENELIVRVEDETQAWQLHGKQTTNPNGIWYTQVSGIWQTVWLEQVSAAHIGDLEIQTDVSAGTIRVVPQIDHPAEGQSVRLVVLDGDQTVATDEANVGSPLVATIADAKLWSPDSPHLYDLRLELRSAEGQPVDTVDSYAGIRSVGQTRDENGDLRFTLNGEILFHLGPLDQGWWPDGLLTPPSDEAMLFDIEYLKAAGFNMIRKHIKVEPRRYYYHCDRLGMMLWQDQVSGSHNPPWTRLDPDPVDAQWPDPAHEQYMLELTRMLDNLGNHPSIVMWVPFNEAWGQHRTVEVGQWLAKADPSRLVNVASGGNFWPVGDIVDHHAYPHPEFPFDPQRFADFIRVVGEFGGHGYPVEGHLWDAARDNWGYGGLPKTKAEYEARYVESMDRLEALKDKGIAGGVYTQTTDVEGEINGLITYDRKVIKIDAERLAELHQALIEPKPE